MRIQWGMVAASLGQEEPNLGDFSRWLEDMAVTASYVTTSSTLVRVPVKEKQNYEHQLWNLTPPPRHSLFTTSNEKDFTCVFCNSPDHTIYNCNFFSSISTEEKRNWVQEHSLCFACLKKGHFIRNCRRKKFFGLRGCQKYHHRQLHSDSSQDKTEDLGVSTPLTALPRGGKPAHVVAHSFSTAPQVLLRLLPVNIFGPKGKIATHALFDAGFTVTLMDHTMAVEMGLTGNRDPLQ